MIETVPGISAVYGDRDGDVLRPSSAAAFPRPLQRERREDRDRDELGANWERAVCLKEFEPIEPLR